MARLTSRSRSLFILLCLALAGCERVGANQLQLRSNQLAKRQLISIPGDDTTTGATASTGGTETNTNTNTNTDTDTNAATTPGTTQETTTQQTTNQQTTNQQTTNQQTTTTTTNANTNTQPTNTQTTADTQTDNTTTEPPTQTQAQPTEIPVSSTTTDANGSVVVVTTFVTSSSTESASASASSASQSASSDDDSDSGLGTGSIIGLSVAGGVAVIGVVAFFIWKFTRKRYTDFDDEPIKWPELNAHANDNLNYELPTDRSKTGAGAGLDSASEVNLNRGASVAAYSAYSQPSQYSHPTAADSTADLYAPGGDPYAVPPLPHLNPNQPYRDDPGLGSQGYYDPYRGPLPQTFNDTASVSSAGPHAGEAIPMSNLGVATAAGRRSPGPQVGLDMGRVSPQPPMAGRQSPGPSLAYDGRTTPGVGPAMGGRQSPGPGPAYGGGY
ncbi:hypothetical protein ACEPAF_8234 [Sanghuangporus sanghuang]